MILARRKPAFRKDQTPLKILASASQCRLDGGERGVGFRSIGAAGSRRVGPSATAFAAAGTRHDLSNWH
jgi:hypothetical protein